MKYLTTILLSLLLASCALMPWVKTVNDIAQAKCEDVLRPRFDVQESAKARGIDLDKYVPYLCTLSDVIAVFTPDDKTRQVDSTPKGDRAVEAAKRLGAM